MPHIGLRRHFTHFFIVDLKKAILGTYFMHKYSLLNRRCLIDHETNVKLPGSINIANPLCLAVKKTEDNTEFCELLTRFDVIT